MDPFPFLPDEVLQRVLELVNSDDLFACKKVCKSWRNRLIPLSQKLRVDWESLATGGEKLGLKESWQEHQGREDQLVALIRNKGCLMNLAVHSSRDEPILHHMKADCFTSVLSCCSGRSLRRLSLGDQPISGIESNQPLLSLSLESLALLTELPCLEILVVGPLRNQEHRLLFESVRELVEDSGGEDLEEEDLCFPRLKRLGIMHTRFDLSSMRQALTAILRKSPLLRELDLDRCSFGKRGLKVACDRLTSFRFAEGFLKDVDNQYDSEDDQDRLGPPSLELVNGAKLTLLTCIEAKRVTFSGRTSSYLRELELQKVWEFIHPTNLKLFSLSVKYNIYQNVVLRSFLPLFKSLMSCSKPPHLTLHLQTTDKTSADHMRKALRDFMRQELSALKKLKSLKLTEIILLLLSHPVDVTPVRAVQPVLFPLLETLEVMLGTDNPTHWGCLEALLVWVEQNPSIKRVVIINKSQQDADCSVTSGPPRTSAEHLEELLQTVVERFRERDLKVDLEME